MPDIRGPAKNPGRGGGQIAYEYRQKWLTFAAPQTRMKIVAISFDVLDSIKNI